MTLHDKYSDLLLLVLLYNITIVNNLGMERSVVVVVVVVLLDKLRLWTILRCSDQCCCCCCFRLQFKSPQSAAPLDATNKNLTGIEESHDLTLVAAGRVLGCFLGRVLGHWNSREDVVVFLPSCTRLYLQIPLRSVKNRSVSTKTVLLRVSEHNRLVRTGYQEEEQRAGQWEVSRRLRRTRSRTAITRRSDKPKFFPTKFPPTLAASVHLSRKSKSLYLLIYISLFSSVQHSLHTLLTSPNK